MTENQMFGKNEAESEMMMTAFDLETTGTNPLEARIVTYCVAHVDQRGEVSGSKSGIVDPGIEIPVEASAVHGITTETARAAGKPTAIAVQAIVGTLRSNRVVCAYNARYDLTVLACELKRLNEPWEWLRELIVIDPLVIDKQVDKYRKGKRTLTVASQVYGVELDNAHSADADAVAAARVFVAQRKRYPQLPTDLAELHAKQVIWAAEQAAGLQSYFRRTNPDAVVDGLWPIGTGV